MTVTNNKLTLSTAATKYLTSSSPEKHEFSQIEVSHFVRWFSDDKTASSLTPDEVVAYADSLSSLSSDYERKIEVVKSFLQFLKKDGMHNDNLSVCLKPHRARVKAPVVRARAAKSVTLTRQGYEDIKVELEKLLEKRLQVIEDIRRAAADKDLSENAPYHAAREEKARLDGRIMELEETLKSATLVEDKTTTSLKAGLGDTIILQDLDSNQECCYTLVNPREVNPAQGKISVSSPIGKALLGRGEGDSVEITVPMGRLRYRVKKLGGSC